MDQNVSGFASRGYSMRFGQSIGMGYVTPDLAVEGTKLKVKMQDKLWDAVVTCDSTYDPKNETIRKDGLVTKCGQRAAPFIWSSLTFSD